MNFGIQLMIYKGWMTVIGILLFAAGVADIRKRQISRRMMLILLMVCCAVLPVKMDFDVIDAVGGLTVGLCAIGISIATREQVGRGDGIVIAAVGLVLGLRKCLFVVCTASFVMCVAAILVLLFKKGSRQTRLPFLPAIFAGYILCAIS